MLRKLNLKLIAKPKEFVFLVFKDMIKGKFIIYVSYKSSIDA